MIRNPIPVFGNGYGNQFLVRGIPHMLKKSPYSLAVLLLLAYVILRVAFLFPRWELGGANAVLSWDVFGYYLYLPAQFIYDDLSTLSFVPEIVAAYGNPSPAMGHAIELANGKQVLTYPLGLSVMYAPFFFLAHLLAEGLGYPADGFSYPYQVAIGLGGICYAWLGLWLVMTLLRRYFEDGVVALTLAALVVGTHYLNYTTADNAMPHNYLFTIYAGILWLTVLWHEKARIGIAIALGALIGLATISRPTELISVLIPLLWGIQDRADIRKKIQHLWQYKSHVAGLALAMIVVGSLQLLYWKSVSGQFFFYSYGDDKGFSFLHPHLIDCLFSFRKGWLIYTPMMVFALIGFVPLFRKYRSFFLALAGFSLVNMYIAFSWDIWWYGGGFGQRTMIQSYPLLAFPLAATIAWMLPRRAWAIAGFTLMFLCTDLNLIQTWQIHAPAGGLRTDYMTDAYYWKVFGSTRAKPSDLKYLDARRELSSTQGREVRLLLEQDAESDSASYISTQHFRSGAQAISANAAHPEIPLYEISLQETGIESDSWFRIKAYVFYETRPGDEGQMAEFRTSFIREGTGETYGNVFVKLQRLAGSWNWYEVQFDRRMPRKPQAADRLKLILVNPAGQHPIWIDDLSITYISPKLH